MKRLQSFYGLKHVFGISTTYTEWRFYWFSESDSYANSDVTPAATNPIFTNEIDEDSEPDDESGGEAADNETTDEETAYEAQQNINIEVHQTTTKRILSATETIAYDNQQIMRLLVSVIRKMYCSPFEAVAEISLERSYITIIKDSWFWSTVNWRTRVLNRHKFPYVGAKKFVLLRDLRGGADGRVWMACTTSGIACVLKFAKLSFTSFATEELRVRVVKEAKANLKHEEKIYKILGVKVKRTTLCGRPVLVLPHFTKADLSDEQVQAKVCNLITFVY
eukprot:Phypoly_transcript_10729.p1 GENE.Phypoly_transcript_10729~~Phypoly_transcript_10729.p1  ORF type:complete len:278 (+),score=20.34 Phypoly_transcript_10729:172-1005(+)